MLSTSIALVAAILSGQALGATLLAQNETESLSGRLLHQRLYRKRASKQSPNSTSARIMGSGIASSL
jgi:hypothetical protein